jgi:trans-aconitate methyltransferase
MDSQTAVSLIREGVDAKQKQNWADLGAGDGTFTKALASLLSDGSTIYAVDKNPGALSAISVAPGVTLQKITGDFTDATTFPGSLDGALLANAIHYVPDQRGFLGRLRAKLKTGGRLIIIEYDMDTANRWVPYPVSLKSLQKMLDSLGTVARKIGNVPSRLNSADIYSAVILK